MSEAVDKAFDGLTENMRRENQRLAGPKQEARQPRLAMEAGVPTVTKTRNYMEDAAVQAKHGDSCSAKRVQAGPSSSTSFGMKSEPPALPRRNDFLLNKGAAAPKPCLIRGDAHVNCRRWLISSRHSLYSDEDNVLPAASLVLPDRGDEF